MVNIKGHFKIDALDKDGKIIDTYEHKNTIMDTGRYNLMSFLRNGTTSNTTAPIGKFVLGTGGYDGGNSPAVYQSNRTNTFSEATGQEFYELNFTVDNLGNTTVTNEEGNPAIKSVVTVTQNNGTFTVEYRFQIPESNANGTGLREYNEAALYLAEPANTIFSMLTFPTRAKDNTIDYDITWSITFG